MTRAGVLAGTLGVFAPALRTAAVDRPRNVVLVSIDTLRRSALRAFDASAPALPNLDAFAAGAARFPRAYSTAPWTLPAHASLLSGLYPHHHGVVLGKAPPLSAHLPTLAAVLHAHGFETVAFTGGGYVDQVFGFRHGFDRYDALCSGPTALCAMPLPNDGAPPDIAVADGFARGIAYLTQRPDPGRRFLLFLHTFATHDYHRLHECIDPLPMSTEVDPNAEYTGCTRGRRQCDSRQWRDLIDRYAADVQGVDRDFARLLDALRRQDLLDSTLIVVTADHGEGFEPERGRIGHGGRLDEDLIRIPLLLSGPGVAAGSRDVPVSLVDVMPMVLTALDLPVPEHIDGRVPGTDSGGSAVRSLLAVEHQCSRGPNGEARHRRPSSAEPCGLAVIAGPLWYMRTPNGEAMYDLDRDPHAYRNLVSTDPAAAALRMLADSVTRTDERRGAVTLPASVVERLRALGY